MIIVEILLPFVVFVLILVWRRSIKNLLVRTRHKIPAGGRRRFAKTTETFMNEVGVLLFVFPVLDLYIQKGASEVTPSYVCGSLIGSMTAFGIASLISVFVGEGEPNV